MSKSSYLIKNMGILTISNFSSKILVFLLVPLYTSVLSTKEYGTYDLAVSTATLLYPILTLNIVDAVMRFLMDKESDKKAIIDRFKLFNPKMNEEEVIEFVEKFHTERGMKYIDDVYEILESNVEVLKIVTFDNDEKLIANLKEKLKKSTSDLAVASTFSNDIEISDIEAQKGLILAKTIKKMGIDKSEVIVLGDSFNDYSMFTEFENSYAMENAIPEIKEIAKYVTDSNNNDGVAKAIYKSLEV